VRAGEASMVATFDDPEELEELEERLLEGFPDVFEPVGSDTCSGMPLRPADR
jgi:hypothetical protein